MISARCLAKIIEFTFTHDRFIEQAIQTKEKEKYNMLTYVIKVQGWNMRSLITITAGVKSARNTHKKYRTPQKTTNPNGTSKKNHENTHQFCIKFLTYLVLNKRKLDNKQELILPAHLT